MQPRRSILTSRHFQPAFCTNSTLCQCITENVFFFIKDHFRHASKSQMAVSGWVTLSDTAPTGLNPGLQASLTMFSSLILASLLLLGLWASARLLVWRITRTLGCEKSEAVHKEGLLAWGARRLGLGGRGWALPARARAGWERVRMSVWLGRE